MIPEQAVEKAARKLAGQYMIDDGFGETSRASAEAGEMWRNFRKAAELALSAAAPFMAAQWMPIETAPKDGTVFIYQNPDEAVSTCNWQADDCGWSWWDIAGDQLAHPVRWMPLPPVVIADHRGNET